MWRLVSNTWWERVFSSQETYGPLAMTDGELKADQISRMRSFTLLVLMNCCHRAEGYFPDGVGLRPPSLLHVTERVQESHRRGMWRGVLIFNA